ncbi:hypothetical protein AWL63_16290 [Sphingomonas panacis]|uniref:Uncharacterized protein n=1 Tax=Sphingomonas panacis TaxID=1560345 RepID=A0A1B3ZCX9_9SPHN|nr:hypothetical protein [Sphingomonas panacis]AOH85276.1 hypothetical protein AWL63_16290 [Sphingomonas panacis]
MGLAPASPAQAATSSFDLIGPRLHVTVTHDGTQLPLQRVPNLAEGDQVSIKLDLLPTQTEHYRLVAAFLRGTVERPDNKWFHEALSWKPKNAELSLTVPKGAQQMALFIVPERGGSASAISSAVRKQPGAFVRAVQELNQASLDRARLDTFLHTMLRTERAAPQTVATVSPVLARSLAIRLKSECLEQPAELQAACLTVDRETLLLADTHSSALADTLAGTPTDLAFQLSSTPQAGYGSYSSYIGVVRDLFRLVGAFQSTQLQFIPALAQMNDGAVTVLLNTPVSFAKPVSVIVLALPAIEAPKPPPLRRADPAALCAAPGFVLPVEGAPLIYATDYAHDMKLRLKRTDGTPVEIPLRADASAGGFVADGAVPAGSFGAVTSGQVHGNWGFAAFDGPSFTLSNPGETAWKPADGTALVVGRTNQLDLTGGGAGCVTQVEMRRGDGAAQAVEWKQSGANGIVATLPLEKIEAGPVSILIHSTGAADPTVMTLRAFQETGSLDELTVYAGDSEALLTGTRLDQVLGATLGKLALQPGTLTRVGKQDRLALRLADPAAASTLVAGKTATADVIFASGRHKSVSVTIAPPRPAATLVRVTAQPAARDGGRGIALASPDVFAQDSRIAFAFHLDGAAMLSGRETIEIATVDGRASTTVSAGKGYDLQDAKTGIVTFVPVEALGPAAFGAVRFRTVRDGTASAWVSLGTVVRLPEIRSVACTGKACRIIGDRLFLIAKTGASAGFEPGQAVPDGFVGTEIPAAAGADGRIFLQLRDAPQAMATVGVR